MDYGALKRKDTTKGPPLRILSLGKPYPPRPSPLAGPERPPRRRRALLIAPQTEEAFEDTLCF
jgi:hypothetical protein